MWLYKIFSVRVSYREEPWNSTKVNWTGHSIWLWLWDGCLYMLCLYNLMITFVCGQHLFYVMSCRIIYCIFFYIWNKRLVKNDLNTENKLNKCCLNRYWLWCFMKYINYTITNLFIFWTKKEKKGPTAIARREAKADSATHRTSVGKYSTIFEWHSEFILNKFPVQNTI